MVDGLNDRVSFVDNTITMMTTVIWDWGVPHEEDTPFEGLKLITCVAKNNEII